MPPLPRRRWLPLRPWTHKQPVVGVVVVVVVVVEAQLRLLVAVFDGDSRLPPRTRALNSNFFWRPSCHFCRSHGQEHETVMSHSFARIRVNLIAFLQHTDNIYIYI